MNRVGPSTLILAALGISAVAKAQTADVPDYGFEWAVIGEPGNRATLPNEVLRVAFAGEPFPEYGAVGYAYRIRVTEVSIGEWFEFVEAYLPFYFDLTGRPFAGPGLTGGSIGTAFGEPFIVTGRRAEQPADMSWEYAARYCNWLHNGKVNELWAFETGVYDTSTFVVDADGQHHHQIGRPADALFWIPTRDEWIKAAHYDPDRYGPGLCGYWTYPDGSNTRPVGGLPPGLGGERNAGVDNIYPMDVASFPDVRSPWGLLDCAGGVYEKGDGTVSVCVSGDMPFCLGRRIKMSSPYVDNDVHDFSGSGEGDPLNTDRIEFYSAEGVTTHALSGLRVASVAPCVADLVTPYGVLDLADITAFAEAYTAQRPEADLAEPAGLWDVADVARFIDVFEDRCGWFVR